jgi:serine/threonine-protein kinase
MQRAGPPRPVEDEQTQRARARLGKWVHRRWRLQALLGVGGAAAVYAAVSRERQRVAVKMLHPELSTHTDVKERFLAEAAIANRIGHRGAVSFSNEGIAEDGSVFLVMELLEGESLAARLERRKRLAPDEVVSLAEELLDVVAVAHARGIVHRDIKPENVFITRDGAIKLLDFGIAAVAAPGRRSTMVGSTLGTPAFMPPEQARGRWDEFDERSDIWSVGATLFAALSGRAVHRADTAGEELLAAMTRKAPSLGEIVSGLPPALVEVVDRALAFEREERWPSARSMQAAVRKARATLPAPVKERHPLEPIEIVWHAAPPEPAPPASERISQTFRRVARLHVTPVRAALAASLAVVFAAVALWAVRHAHTSRVETSRLTLVSDGEKTPVATVPLESMEAVPAQAESAQAPGPAEPRVDPSQDVPAPPQNSDVRPRAAKPNVKPAVRGGKDSASHRGKVVFCKPRGAVPMPGCVDPLDRRK